MRKILAVILALFICVTCAAAESNSGEEPARPSRAWLGSLSAGLVNDLNTLSSDADFIAAMGLPDELAELISPAAAYEPEPSLALYLPVDTLSALSLLAGGAELPAVASENSDELSLRMLTGMLYQYCSSEQIAISAVSLNKYCFHAPIAPTLAFFAPADGVQGDPVMIRHSGRNGIVSMSACYVPLSVYNELLNPASDLSASLAEAGVDILRAGDASPEFSESAAIPSNIPVADEAWLAQTALEVAQRMLDKYADSEYVRLFTTDEAVIDICANIGNVSLDSAQVGSITYLSAGDLAILFDSPYSSNNQALFEKYYAPKLGAFSSQFMLNYYGVSMVAAGSICATGDVRAAAGDFTSCIVVLSTGCGYDIAVSFGMVEDNIVAISALPIPAE